ncbi:cell division protein FtsL [Dokdonella ginsengisoli]|uniref:Cell division protein FtsL n=1 Tax=Dokdonella ginsengisoli TaxID=363846 RepID=A0ABV9QV20_9GAMM
MKIAGAIVLVILLLVTLASALAVVQARQQSRSLFVELSRLGSERDDLNFEFGRLQLEQATWAENSRVEQIARGKLGMVSPGPAETVVIKR